MSSARQSLGARGEALAERWLVDHGFRIVERNYRSPYGEIDRIARTSDGLAFIEVKTRRSRTYGRPAEAVTAFKRRQIVRAAAHYLSERADENLACRFDVIEVVLTDGCPPAVHHLPAAFGADEWSA